MTDVHVPKNSRIVQASYLEKHSSKVRFVATVDGCAA
jgi:hypothetical protein